jgi:hypothetical protein
VVALVLQHVVPLPLLPVLLPPPVVPLLLLLVPLQHLEVCLHQDQHLLHVLLLLPLLVLPLPPVLLQLPLHVPQPLHVPALKQP